MSFNNDFNHLKMKLEDIKSATNNFSDKPIGVGGFGKVFKGELLLPDGGKKMVALKRLDRKYGQGDVEFWKEIMMLSQYKHENLISLLGYCDDDREKILVYEYASGGSLDRYLDKTSLTWTQLLKICLEAARGLNHLHDPVAGTQQRVLHRDVKSSNILLDENLTAKISDFGLSKLGPANQQYTYLVSHVVGTPGYCDPMYMETGSLSKESDVYSFGVVLFEVMCGRSCYDISSTGEENILVHKWKKCYEENGIYDIISDHLKGQMDIDICYRDSLKTFASIAYRCLHRDRKDRPTMAEVVNELVVALDIQETSGDDERNEYTELVGIAKHATVPQDTPDISWAMMRKPFPLTGRGRTELASLLSQGIHVLEGEHRVERNENGEFYELLSGFKCLPRQLRLSGEWRQFYNFDTRVFFWGKGFPCISISSSNKLEACPRFLSLNVTYNMNLYYRYLDEADKGVHVPFKYKLQEEKEYWTSCVAQRRGDWLITTLYQFTSYQKEHDFKIEVIGQLHHPDHVHHDGVQCEICALFLVGIEFKPVEHEKDENLEDEIKVDMQPNLDTDWEGKLPGDYAEIIKLSKDDNMQSKTHEELYYLLRSGFLIHTNVEKWFSVTKSMKKRYMLPAIVVLKKGSTSKSLFGMQRLTWKLPFPKKRKLTWKSLPESRFEMVAECCKIKEFAIVCELESQLLSLETTYACYLVYKLPTNPSLVSGLIQIDDKTRVESNHKLHLVDLLTPTHIPFVRRRVDEPRDIPIRTRKIKGHPKLRKDGWLEIQIWDFHTDATHKPITMHCHVKSYDQCNLTGLLVQGIEFRPAKVSFVSSP